MTIFNLITLKGIQLLHKLRKCEKLLLSTIKTKEHNYHVCNKELCTIPRNGLWKVLFFGTDEYAVECLKALHYKYESKVLQQLEVVTVVKKIENAVVKYAKEKNITINEWPLEINVSKFHIGVVVSFGHLIPSSIINSFPLGMINVHASLLPRWRGAAPIIHSLMNGDEQTGVTIMKIKPKKFDIGEIILQKKIDIGKHETFPELYTKLAKFGANLLIETFENLPQLLQSAIPQHEMDVTYAPKITSEIAVIKWNEMSAKTVYDLYRALVGLHPLFTTFQDKKVKLYDIQNIEEPVIAGLQEDMSGTVIYDKRRKALIVKCKGESFISVKKIGVHGKSVMNALDFYNGYISGKNKRKACFS